MNYVKFPWSFMVDISTVRCSGDGGRTLRSSQASSTCRSRALGTNRSTDVPAN